MKIEKPTTPSIRQAHKYLTTLEEYADVAIKGTFFRSRPVSEIIDYIKELSNARANIWTVVALEYPGVQANPTATVSNTSVSWEDEETVISDKTEV